MVGIYSELEQDSDVHPVVKAAWLHHRFVQIHPFADGNGRVARALTLLTLEKHHYAPLVIDRFHRTDYFDALDKANGGDLSPLVGLFVRLESSALTSELERPEDVAPVGFATDVAHTLAEQIAALRKQRVTEVQRALRVRALSIGTRVKQWFERKEQDLRRIFGDQGLDNVTVKAFHATHDDAERLFWFCRTLC